MPTSVHPFFHADSCTWTYLVWDADSRRAAVVDPVLDFDQKSGATATRSATQVLAAIRDQALQVDWILETHAHADHLSAGQWFKQQCPGATLAIGSGIRAVQRTFRTVFNLGEHFPVDGSQFDRLFEDEARFALGRLEGRVIATPGHTNDSVSYLIGDALFVGDSLFMPDGGTARCDFPGGSAALLYRSIQRLYALPADTRVFVCHDYAPGGRDHRCETTIAAQRAGNIHVRDGVAESDYVAVREARDATLDMPALLLPSVQVNIRAGAMPEAEANGVSYLKLPLNQFGRRA
ncbi:MAG TPA: MBL fold metallo-hydrolase [Pseudomonadota bacterium]|jgi:glyoxylase-like metal-dependent hydrolase (beta-lactamase superfamily II)|nr:MBL fold metallo-hydrolase [Pseudomonadota bacterium]